MGGSSEHETCTMGLLENICTFSGIHDENVRICRQPRIAAQFDTACCYEKQLFQAASFGALPRDRDMHLCEGKCCLDRRFDCKPACCFHDQIVFLSEGDVVMRFSGQAEYRDFCM